jgi:hypothetical protein
MVELILGINVCDKRELQKNSGDREERERKEEGKCVALMPLKD